MDLYQWEVLIARINTLEEKIDAIGLKTGALKEVKEKVEKK
jgi:hypothetical protein